MSLLSCVAITIVLSAVAGLFLNMPDHWFCGLLALGSLLGSADAAYRELTLWAVLFLAAGVLLTGGAAHAVVADSRSRGPR